MSITGITMTLTLNLLMTFSVLSNSMKPNVTDSNIVNDIETCNYYQDSDLCEELYTLCWSDDDCFNAFFVNYDNLMNILSNNINLINNNFSVQIMTSFSIINASINKYHCNSDYNDYTLNNYVCNDIFFNLMDCILNKCMFENDNNNCYWSSCSEEINNCLIIDSDQAFDTKIIETNPAICYQGLYWLSWTYFNKNNDDDIILEYIQYVDVEDCDDNIQCYYYNIVGYCIKNMCTDSFWSIIDCIFENNCIGVGDNIDKSLSGTTLDIFNDDKICLIGTYQYNIWFESSFDDYNLCQVDFYKYFACNFFGFRPDNATLYSQQLTSYSDYNNLYGGDCDASTENSGFIDGSLYFYPDCSKKNSFRNEATNDQVVIYIVGIYEDTDLYEKRALTNWDAYYIFFAFLNDVLINTKTYQGEASSPLLPWDYEYLFGSCPLIKNWTQSGYNWTAYTESKSPTNIPTNQPTTIEPTSRSTTDDGNDSATCNYINAISFCIYYTICCVFVVLI